MSEDTADATQSRTTTISSSFTKLQALAAHAKVSKYPKIQNLVATCKDEDFIYVICELCRGTCPFPPVEVQDSHAEYGSSKDFSCYALL